MKACAVVVFAMCEISLGSVYEVRMPFANTETCAVLLFLQKTSNIYIYSRRAALKRNRNSPQTARGSMRNFARRSREDSADRHIEFHTRLAYKAHVSIY